METIELMGGALTLSQVEAVARHGARVVLSDEAKARVNRARELVERTVKEGKVRYGITTGFGKFSETTISEADSVKLQKNLIMSHSCGVGKPFDPEIVRAMLLLRAGALSVGHSGIRLSTIETLLEMLNRDILPVVPEKGSLGASGDLVPLSHMALALMGMGPVTYKGKVMSGEEALGAEGLSPVSLTAKEGLALNNGTQAMTAIGALALWDAENLVKTADILGAFTVEALTGIVDAFDPGIHLLRGQPGQQASAENIRKLLAGSGLATRQGEKRVQDAYALRCIPQIHGATRDSVGFIGGVIRRELNAVTDNPLLFPDRDLVLSGGNFHGQYPAMAMDFLAIAASELADVSERRVERMVNPQLSNGLPAFLTRDGGLNSGFMIAQYTAAALVSENKVLAHPACVDSIPTSANQEDHVSMGMTSARKAREVIQNVTDVLGVELMCAAQAADLRGAEKLSPAASAVYKLVREEVPFLPEDDVLAPYMARCSALISSGRVAKAAESAVGEIA